MINVNNKTCTGCGACANTCPKDCITLQPDINGFIYPVISIENCINCKKCESACHASIKDKTTLYRKEKNRIVYYGWCIDDDMVMQSSSGGAFSKIVSSWFDDEEGYVYGAAFSSDYKKVLHIECSSSDIAKLRKSKYCFSSLNDCFVLIKKRLCNNKKVIFSGTPCQVAALNLFLGKKYENLLTIDFICHGTPSEKFYREHIDRIVGDNTITNVDFRSKAFGWRTHCLKIDYGNKQYLMTADDDFYMYSFLNNHILRRCCYECQYSLGNHVSDITLADFWGIKHFDPQYTDNKGVSLLIFNYSNQYLLSKLQSEMKLTRLEYEDYKYIFKDHTTYDLSEREKVLKMINESSFADLSRKWSRNMWLRKAKHLVNRLVLKIKK